MLAARANGNRQAVGSAGERQARENRTAIRSSRRGQEGMCLPRSVCACVRVCALMNDKPQVVEAQHLVGCVTERSPPRRKCGAACEAREVLRRNGQYEGRPEARAPRYGCLS